MIEEIAIADLGAITNARLELGTGLTVITGETGAGKTMLLTGLELLDVLVDRPRRDGGPEGQGLVDP